MSATKPAVALPAPKSVDPYQAALAAASAGERAKRERVLILAREQVAGKAVDLAPILEIVDAATWASLVGAIQKRESFAAIADERAAREKVRLELLTKHQATQKRCQEIIDKARVDAHNAWVAAERAMGAVSDCDLAIQDRDRLQRQIDSFLNGAGGKKA